MLCDHLTFCALLLGFLEAWQHGYQVFTLSWETTGKHISYIICRRPSRWQRLLQAGRGKDRTLPDPVEVAQCHPLLRGCPLRTPMVWAPSAATPPTSHVGLSHRSRMSAGMPALPLSLLDSPMHHQARPYNIEGHSFDMRLQVRTQVLSQPSSSHPFSLPSTPLRRSV